MVSYIFGAGASAHAGYPLASKILHGVSRSLHPDAKARAKWQTCLEQAKALTGSLDDFEGILARLDEYGPNPVKIESQGCRQTCAREILEETDSANFFYPQNLRDSLASAIRDFFFDIEWRRTEPTRYDRFSEQHVSLDDTLITFNYDVALERALRKAGKWDIGTGYGFPLFADRPTSPVTIFKLHGSANWFQGPLQTQTPPLVFPRDLKLLGYFDLRDPRTINGSAVSNTGTLILPDPSKEFYWGDLWHPLWEAAALRIRESDEVFIHGYSLPQADTRARNLLFENINNRAKINIFCKADSERIAEEFRQRGFAKVKSNSTLTFESWVEHLTVSMSTTNPRPPTASGSMA